MSDTNYTNQNLAGILSVALGLEDSGGRASFSSAHREALRAALDDPSSPETFADLLQTLRTLKSDAATIGAVETRAASDPSRSLQDFALHFGRESQRDRRSAGPSSAQHTSTRSGHPPARSEAGCRRHRCNVRRGHRSRRASGPREAPDRRPSARSLHPFSPSLFYFFSPLNMPPSPLFPFLSPLQMPPFS